MPGDRGQGRDSDPGMKGQDALPRIRFSSDDLDPGLSDAARRKLWYELYTARYGEVDIDWRSEGPFRAASEFMLIDDVAVGRFDFTFSHLARTRSHMTRDGREDLLIGFVRGNSVSADLHGREVAAHPGGVVFYTNALPAEFRSAAGVSAISLTLPAHALTGKAGAMPDRLGRLLDPANPAVHMLGRYLDLLLAAGDTPLSGLLQDHVRRTLVDLAALAVGAGGEDREQSVAAARLAAIKADIRHNVGQRDLSVAAVARRHRVTARYVHLLFEAEAMSFMEYVTAERLAAAHRMLTGPGYGRLRISDVAFAVGFSDLSTFNRQFRRAYGETPSGIRDGALRSPPPYAGGAAQT